MRQLSTRLGWRLTGAAAATVLAGAALLAAVPGAGASTFRPHAGGKPKVAIIAPAVAAPGLPIYITGQALKPVSELFFYPQPTPKGAKGHAFVKGFAAEPNTTQFSFTVPKKFSKGRYNLVVKTKSGKSNRKLFRVVPDSSYRAGEACPGEWGDLEITGAHKKLIMCTVITSSKLRWEVVKSANTNAGSSSSSSSGSSSGSSGATTPGTIHQTSTTVDSVPAGDPYTGQLSTDGTGAVNFTTTSPSAYVSVSSSGAISASDTVPVGTYTVLGTDADSAGDTGTWTFTLTETAGTIYQTSTPVDSISAGDPYTGQLSTNSTGTVTYNETVSTDSTDVVVSSTGAISAADTVVAGSYAVSGTDADDIGNSGTWTFTLTIIAGTISQTTPTSATTSAGTAYSGQLAVTGSSGTVTYTETTSTDSIDVVVSSTGAISAADTVPAGAGPYSVSGTDEDSVHNTGKWSFALTVGAVTLSQTSPTLASAAYAAGYSGQITTNGTGVTFTTNGTSSSEVSVGSTGAITVAADTPPGTYAATGSDSNSLGDHGTWTFTFTVDTFALTLSATSFSLAAGGTASITPTNSLGTVSCSSYVDDSTLSESGCEITVDTSPAETSDTFSVTVTDQYNDTVTADITVTVTS